MPHPTPPPVFPNATPLAEADYFGLVLVLVVVLLLVTGLAWVVSLVRKRMNGADEIEPTGGFSLGGLRDLVRQGKMSQAEYDAAKAQIVAAHHRATARRAAEMAARGRPAVLNAADGFDGETDDPGPAAADVPPPPPRPRR